jgi:hypothetical protein
MGQFHSPAALSPWQEPRFTYQTGGWLGPKTGPDVVAKLLSAMEPRPLPNELSRLIVIFHTY